MDRIVGNRYELVRPLGRGGMGEVWLGRDTRLDRDVAVKLLRPGSLPAGSDVETLISRFGREARLMAKLENPGVPAVYDTGTDHEDLYLVMQLIGGADLAEFEAENEPVPIGWVAAIGAQIASVLTAAHAAGLVHRDLKPRNVMITHSGEVKVLDFGIAVLRDADLTRITRSAEAVGTPAYMAPEQAMHGVSSPSSDLYSLGCVLYELITGRHVFDASTALAIMHRHYSEVPAPVSALRPETDPHLADLVSRLLAKDPGARPASAKEVFDVLVRLIPTGGNGAAIPMDPTRPFREWRAGPQRATPPPPPLLPPPIFPVPAHTTPIPRYVDPPTARVSRFDTPGRRLTEGTLLTLGFMFLGFVLDDALDHKTPTEITAGLAFSLLLLGIGVWMRQRRLRLRFPWSLAWRRVIRPATKVERGVERTLLIVGGLMVAVYLGGVILDWAGVQRWDYTNSRVFDLTISLGLFLPGVIMRQHRLGKRYPWYV
ncbi:serine/threonine-protein kinase [Actinocrispum wychmicini]|uniref:non-specific serine/threonine protein kinase n=1 Tax=Actinocrispum wychmicini TaxID=1213861 RepID=A0A4R2JAW6_9PSEU|nr:serine/threonine-protein kinase [Actinocrispum wychmicini]TCO55022.1 serine/threonine protein kinase [Actinocrispum wychmicini]